MVYGYKALLAMWKYFSNMRYADDVVLMALRKELEEMMNELHDESRKI